MSDDDIYANVSWHDRTPIFIELDELDDREKELLIEDKHFCILPWVHLHGYPDGRAYPCCDSQYDFPVGNFNKSSMAEVWNNDKMKEIRRNMLNKTDCAQCKNCYEEESHGETTMRHSMNKHFGQHIKEVLPNTHPDGTADIFKFRYYDIRFSNLCNMKCRSCGDTFSSLWADENRKRFDNPDFSEATKAKVIYSGRFETDIQDQLTEHLPYVEQIYFAGGEPLMMPEHYTLIDGLISRGMNHVRIAYNTNFSKLDYGKHDLLEDWKFFDSVAVGASLDINGARGEYLRKGTKWDKIVQNRRKMIAICPDVNFYISPTVSLFNILTIADFHKEWVELGLIEANHFHLNILQGPIDRRVDVLPPEIKDRARTILLDHIIWLETQSEEAQSRCIPEYQSLITMMDADDKSHLIPEFFRINDPLDAHRDEKFDVVFPELQEMRKYAK